jgi:hypothetical protein
MESDLEDLVTPNPTPDNGGASTLDRLERYLAAQDAPDEPNPEESSDDSAQHDVKPDGDGQKSDEPQLSTSDLAKLLGLDDGALDLDEEGSVKIKTKVDGIEGAAKLQDLIKSYQLQEHVDKKSRETAEREKAFQVKQQEAEQQFAQRIQYAEGLANIAAQQLMQEFQSVDWKALEAQDPGTAALWRQKFQEKQAHLRGVFHNIQQERANTQAKTDASTRESLQKEAERLPMLIPEWKDAALATKERAEIRDWAIKAGYEPSEIDGISKAHHVAMLRKAMLADRLQSQKAEVENKVRKAPVLVKPGQPAQNTQSQNLQNLKTAVRKSGGKGGSVAAYLLAAGKV